MCSSEEEAGCVDGEIRIAVGKCLRVFAYFELLFGVPASAFATMTGLKPPISVAWMLAWGIGQAVVGSMIARSGTLARQRARAARLNVAMERAIRLG
jgi:hypothetical protein